MPHRCFCFFLLLGSKPALYKPLAKAICTLCRDTHIQTNKHNHNPPWHLPVSDLSHPVAWTVSVTMSCALWQFSPSGWSTGPYGAIQGHRGGSDEKHISWISNTEFTSPCALEDHCISAKLLIINEDRLLYCGSDVWSHSTDLSVYTCPLQVSWTYRESS